MYVSNQVRSQQRLVVPAASARPQPGRSFSAPTGALARDHGVTDEIARFFQGIRRVLHVSTEQAAKILMTDANVIRALDAGDIERLPPWPETKRIVSNYISLAGIDPEPALQMIGRSLAESLARVAAAQPPVTPRLPARSATSASATDYAPHNRLARLKALTTRRPASMLAVTLPIALLVVLTTTEVPQAAVSRMPEGVTRVVKTVQEYVRAKLAPVRDGLRWIEVGDPRSRRGDKLR